MKKHIRTVTTVGSSIGITLPQEMAAAYGLKRGDLVELEPTEEGLLVKPTRVVSALEPEGRRRVREIIERYRPALDAMSRHDRSTKGR